ncbi:methyltransferase domain-containing protein [Gammaproteobacteria bacterium]|nr:methyltransferase domain-containing protein [Gammaproteobacteria bacterium]
MIDTSISKLLLIDHEGDEVLSLIQESYHENFGYQWNKFNKLQLDSFNGSFESRDRLIEQSELSDNDFKDKTILEIGAGNGRFTEILLDFGAKVIAVDFSSAIYANYRNNLDNVKAGNLLCIRGDVFDLPLEKSSFDYVICYGVIQHTGDNKKCLDVLASYVNDSGSLLVDIYSNSLKDYNPWIYLIRPFFSRIRSDKRRMEIVSKFVGFVFPLQVKILTFLQNRSGIFKYIRYFFNRSPNSVYGINLFLDGKISIENAKDWSICDTNDAWTPRHDDPVSFTKWNELINSLSEKYGFSVDCIKKCGQGNCATLKKL